MIGMFKLIQTLVYALLLNFQADLPEAVCLWYGEPFHGRQTASGIVYNMDELTFAHKTMPLGQEALLWCPETNVFRIARNTDRGPFVIGRDIDCSRKLFSDLTKGDLDRGIVKVYYFPLEINTEDMLYINN